MKTSLLLWVVREHGQTGELTRKPRLRRKQKVSMITRPFADTFAAEWIDAWNKRDLDRVLSHYADDFTFSSPFIASVAGEPSSRLTGRVTVRRYWSKV